MDYTLLTGDDLHEIVAIKSFLNMEFKAKDLGEINYFLGMEIIREKHGFITSQHQFALNLIQEVDTCHCSSITSPLDPSIKLQADGDVPLSNDTTYMHLVGKLNYLTHTCPYLAFPVLRGQFMQRPCHSYCFIDLHVLKYLTLDLGRGIFLSSNPSLSLQAFCDVD